MLGVGLPFSMLHVMFTISPICAIIGPSITICGGTILKMCNNAISYIFILDINSVVQGEEYNLNEPQVPPQLVKGDGQG